jgi:ribosomal protein L32
MSDENNTEEHKVSGDTEIQDYKGKTTLRVVLDKDKIKEEIKEELGAEKRLDDGIKYFEALREMAISQHRELEDQINSCESPGQIMEILEQAKNEKKPEKKRAPAGKSTMLPPSDSEQYANNAEMLDSLYDTAYYSKTATSEEREAARKKIDKLFESLIEGRSWDQIKRSKDYATIIKTNIESCSNCGKTLISGAVCSCGYDAYSKKHRPKTWERGL